jgi:hypothetical protein
VRNEDNVQKGLRFKTRFVSSQNANEETARKSRDSSVAIPLGYGLDDRDSRV